jgi:4-hydroxybenzoate polyprenyltransferase
MTTAFNHRFFAYWQLMRLDKPIGTFLLLWPTLWSLWIAGEGQPNWDLVIIFIVGTFIMRAAGCVINDYADRGFDGQVKRTRQRPLVTGRVSTQGAIALFIGLALAAFLLVLMTNQLTIQLSFGGLVLAFCYPFMKRHTYLPQVFLGAAFSWGIPMAYTAQTGELNPAIWILYIANLLWTVAYDTFYAMVDRDDDLKIGVKSSAILFGTNDRIITALLQALTLVALLLAGSKFDLGLYYIAGLALAGCLFVYQQWLIRLRRREDCFRAFLNNNYVGLVIFAGLALDYSLGSIGN